ncbi:MAG TPA: IS200/IS605 family transposase [Chloroflexia bacterium]|nr:IS200/IS605 family transposase [Chloroflexia bacterium]
MTHTFTHLVTHVIFATKERTPLIRPDMKEDLHAYMGGIVREMGGKAIIINGMPDHVHLLIYLPPTVAIAEAVRVLKANSSRWVHEKWPGSSEFGWQRGYGAFSVSRTIISHVERYIATQEEHHRTITFEEEFVGFLRRHGMEYDVRYLWQ